MHSVAAADVSGKKVIVRADLDLAVGEGQVETFRLDRLVPTIKSLLDRGATVRIIAHRGRPEGRVDPSLTNEDFVPILSEKLDLPVSFGGDPTQNQDLAAPVTLFENLRFYPGEEANSPEFVQALTRLGEIYVNESFATVHRSHASIVSLPKYLPHFAGLNLLAEIENLSKIIASPARPLVVIVGGAKLESKRPLVDFMANIADEILLGGAFVNETLPESPKLVLPVDNIDGKDIGPATIGRFKESLAGARTIVWNGPMGAFEDPKYAQGTRLVGQAVAGSRGAFTVVGGGDTIAALEGLGVLNLISFVSTGGGAMLEFLSGKTLPGIEALG
jgi:3-phosphoglycerate kinase